MNTADNLSQQYAQNNVVNSTSGSSQDKITIDLKQNLHRVKGAKGGRGAN